jgi:ABC-type phosphonate transport system ATPase subunit
MSREASLSDDVLLCVRDLRIAFVSGRSLLPAVDGIGFRLAAGETLALLGESGAASRRRRWRCCACCRLPGGSPAAKCHSRDAICCACPKPRCVAFAAAAWR